MIFLQLYLYILQISRDTFLFIACKNVQKKQTFSSFLILSAGWVAFWVAGATRFMKEFPEVISYG
jgi:hypothetical protein